MNIPRLGRIEAFAMIVDINQFTPMVTRAETNGDSIAQFVRDCLCGAVKAIETEGGEVVGFMGDALLAVFSDCDSVATACFGIAKDLDRTNEYISLNQAEFEHLWGFAPGGPALKLSIEYGTIDVSTIGSRFLGEHRLLIGSPINYAARISSARTGNRCVIGPKAVQTGFSDYPLEGPFVVGGKAGEPEYSYYLFPMDDIWKEGQIDEESYMG